jgi:hypothetical protein
MLKTAANPGGLPIDVFDGIRKGVLADRSQLFKDLTMPFYGYKRPGAKVSEGVRESFWLQEMMAGFPASYFCLKAFSETDQTEDLKKIDVPTLILHGDDDQIVPIADSALLSAKLVKNATLKVYKGAPHGMCTTLKDQGQRGPARIDQRVSGHSLSQAQMRRLDAVTAIALGYPHDLNTLPEQRAVMTGSRLDQIAYPPRTVRRCRRRGCRFVLSDGLHLCETAIDKQFRSRDVAAVVGCEKHDRLGDLVGRAEPSERDTVGNHLQALLARF